MLKQRHTQSQAGMKHLQISACLQSNTLHCNPHAIQINLLTFTFFTFWGPHTLAVIIPGPLLTLCGSSGCIPEYPCGLGGASISLILSTDSLLRCRVLANDGSQELDLAHSCSCRWNNHTIFQLCISRVCHPTVALLIKHRGC